MKRRFELSCLLLFALALAYTNTVKSQDIKKELDEFAKKFEAAYNKQDDKTLKMMYTDSAVRTDPDGTVIEGSENIRTRLTQDWLNAKFTLIINQDKVESQADGSFIVKGRWYVKGAANSGDPINVGGAYTNTMVKDNGNWKISKSVLTDF